MCDDLTNASNDEFLAKSGGISRRRFGQLAAGGSLVAALPSVANAMDVAEDDVMVPMAEGVSDCYFVRPVTGKHAAIVLWPDIMSIRPAFRQMGKRLAQSGYSVLVVNPYYRTFAGRITPEGGTFADEAVRNLLFPQAGTLSPETCVSDGRDYVAWLDQQDSVSTSRKIGSAGYCMTGSYVMRMAADMPDRIGAGASFHGGGLVSDDASSPHLLADQINAGLLIAIAVNDDESQPGAKDALASAFGDKAEVEVYQAQHGWCPLDSHVYDYARAEKGWARMLDLFDRELA
jgi:carboxymethylenebutenolidase|tara:strand:+ start:89025 stop:89891 length:867 start_codon:yes stop_codon:yes gene_type:complete